MIKNNRSSSTKFSVQQLISCDYDSNKGLEGCRGGEIIKAFETIVVCYYNGRKELKCLH